MHWLKKGDMDTKYFHALASSQNKIKYIGWLEDEEGRRVESQEEICSLLFDYFEGLFLAMKGFMIQLYRRWHPKYHMKTM